MEVFEDEVSRGNLHGENLPEFLCEIRLICVWRSHFTYGDALGELPEETLSGNGIIWEIFVWGLPTEEIVHGGNITGRNSP